jgi:20S proteasome alpha/beta subunit
MRCAALIIMAFLMSVSPGKASINVLVSTYDGMAIATDSRITLVDADNVRVASDTYQKIFQVGKICGVTTTGAAFLYDFNGERRRIGSFIDAFEIRNGITDTSWITPKDVVDSLRDIVEELYRKQPLNHDQEILNFWIFGYDKKKNRKIYELNSIKRVRYKDNPEIQFSISEDYPDGSPGSLVGGQTDVCSRLIKGYDPAFIGMKCFQDEKERIDDLRYDIRYEFMSLQDAIDFAVFIVRATIESQRFNQKAIMGVGGAIDIAVITPEGFRWIQRKHLTGEGGSVSH